MIIIGELINGTRKRIKQAIADRDDGYVSGLAVRQAEAGAAFIDCNPGTVGDQEIEDIRWLVQTVQAVTDLPISFDTPNVAALRAAFDVYEGAATPMINSITAEQERIDAMLEFVAQSGANIVALALSDAGMPSGCEDRVAAAVGLVDTLTGAGIDAGRIFVDPVIAPLGTDAGTGRAVMGAVTQLRAQRPGIHITCGLSNISYGLPERKLLNRTFMTLCIGAGMDSAIIDPLDEQMMATVYAAEALAGCDEWCMNYITASRQNRLGV
ncbi:MAG TPA: methyltetrahydrofolate--corrinoid methyltransferase [Armatimonadetes bacterium]|jgi:5-methyltetrahydrofolate--homocysteine methyltransferase|nr:methyltetrahydrofolate--corrinoid methyltransferase [Armatimonadota bacterium]